MAAGRRRRRRRRWRDNRRRTAAAGGDARTPTPTFKGDFLGCPWADSARVSRRALLSGRRSRNRRDLGKGAPAARLARRRPSADNALWARGACRRSAISSAGVWGRQPPTGGPGAGSPRKGKFWKMGHNRPQESTFWAKMWKSCIWKFGKISSYFSVPERILKLTTEMWEIKDYDWNFVK